MRLGRYMVKPFHNRAMSCEVDEHMKDKLAEMVPQNGLQSPLELLVGLMFCAVH